MHYFISMHRIGWPCLKENPSLTVDPPMSMEIIPKAWMHSWKFELHFISHATTNSQVGGGKIIFSLPTLGLSTIKIPEERNQGKAYDMSYI